MVESNNEDLTKSSSESSEVVPGNMTGFAGVRAKFKVDSIERSRFGQQELATVKMSPVYANNDPEHENSKFWAYTPSGSLHLGTVNAAAAEQFELGAEYYVDFTRAPQQ